MKDFNLKKYLKNNPLLNEAVEDVGKSISSYSATRWEEDDVNEDRFEKVEHVFSGEDDPKLIQWREDRD